MMNPNGLKLLNLDTGYSTVAMADNKCFGIATFIYQMAPLANQTAVLATASSPASFLR